MGSRFGVDFFDKLQLPYLLYGEVKTVPMAEIKKVYKSGDIEDDTQFFDTSIIKLEDYRNAFVKPLGQHWLSRKIAG